MIIVQRRRLGRAVATIYLDHRRVQSVGSAGLVWHEGRPTLLE